MSVLLSKISLMRTLLIVQQIHRPIVVLYLTGVWVWSVGVVSYYHLYYYSATSCCYGCSGNTEDNKLLNFARNKFASSLQWAEYYVGLSNGSLLQIPPSRPTNCTNVDARLM